MMVVGDRHRDSRPAGIVRVAEERGFSESLSDWHPGWDKLPAASFVGEPVRIQVPLEIRARADPVLLHGCVLQPFRLGVTADRGFLIDSLSAPPGLRIEIPPGADSVIQPGERRLITVLLTKTSSDPRNEDVGIRIDERSSMLGSTGGCASLVAGGDSIQYYRFRRLEVEPLGPALAGGVIVLLTLVLLGR
jgi:hypothetical protein